MAGTSRRTIGACVAVLALALAGCEAGALKSGSFSAGIQKFTLPDQFATLFGKPHGKTKKAALRSSRKPVHKASVRQAAGSQPAPAVAMEPQDIRAVLTGNSLYAGGGGLEFAALHREDGAMVGRTWSSDGTIQGTGSWRLEDDGTYCRKWDNEWAEGAWGCFMLVRKDGKLSLKRVSGVGSDGDMTLVPGNAYGL